MWIPGLKMRTTNLFNGTYTEVHGQYYFLDEPFAKMWISYPKVAIIIQFYETHSFTDT